MMNPPMRGFPMVNQPINNEPTLHKSWSKIAEFPPNLITPENVLDYFCDARNPFYDTSSTNQHLIMQGMPMSNLPLMTGIQFNMVHHCGPLYIICKFKRTSESSITPLCYYYIMDGVVYQCPDLYTLIQSRLTQSVNPLREALLQSMKYTKFDVNKGYSWQFDVEPAKSSETINEEKEKKIKKTYQDPTKVKGSQYQWTRADKILQMTLRKFPPVGMDFLPIEKMEGEPSNPGSVATTSQHAGTPIPQQSFGINGSTPASMRNPSSIPQTILPGSVSKPATPAVGSNIAPQTPRSVTDNPGSIPATMSAPGSALGSNAAINASGPSSVPSKGISSPAIKKTNPGR